MVFCARKKYEGEEEEFCATLPGDTEKLLGTLPGDGSKIHALQFSRFPTSSGASQIAKRVLFCSYARTCWNLGGFELHRREKALLLLPSPVSFCPWPNNLIRGAGVLPLFQDVVILHDITPAWFAKADATQPMLSFCMILCLPGLLPDNFAKADATTTLWCHPKRAYEHHVVALFYV